MPKLKKPTPGETPDAEIENLTPEEGQSDALSGLLDSVANTTEQAAEENPEATFTPPAREDEEEPIDAGENPETAPPAPGEAEATFSAPEKRAPKATTVRVATVIDHSCFIGGKAYHFKRGVPVNVPTPVKDILKQAGILAAL